MSFQFISLYPHKNNLAKQAGSGGKHRGYVNRLKVAQQRTRGDLTFCTGALCMGPNATKSAVTSCFHLSHEQFAINKCENQVKS